MNPREMLEYYNKSVEDWKGPQPTEHELAQALRAAIAEADKERETVNALLQEDRRLWHLIDQLRQDSEDNHTQGHKAGLREALAIATTIKRDGSRYAATADDVASAIRETIDKLRPEPAPAR